MKSVIKKFFSGSRILSVLRNTLKRLPTPFASHHPLLEKLTPFSGRLEQAIVEVEPRFLRLGEHLQSLYDSASQLIHLSEESVRVISFDANEEGESESVTRLIRQSGKELAACRTNIVSSLEQLETWIDQLSHLEKICPAIEQIGKTLNVVGMNMAVESSRSDAAQTMFQALSSEIRELSQQIIQISGNIISDSASVMKDQKYLRGNIEKELGRMDQYREKAKSLVEASASEVGSLIGLTSGALDRSSGHFRKISDQVGQVVMALQIHDIIRQRIEHIVQTLQDVQKLHKGELNDSDLPRKSVRRLIHRLLTLQGEQLSEVGADIENARNRIEGSFDQLGIYADDFASDSNSLGDSVHRGNLIRSNIDSLTESLGHLHDLLGQGRKIESDVQGLSANISDTASGLSAYIEKVRRISMALRLKALNAIIKSDLLQHQGRAMEVLAHEVNRLSLSLDESVTEVVSILRGLAQLLPDWKTDETQWVEEDSSIRELLDRSRECEENMVKILQDAGQLKQYIGTAQAELPFLGDLANRVQAFIRELADIAGAVKTDKRIGDGSSKEDAEVERIARRYTMAGERNVHRQHNVQFVKDEPSPALESKDGRPLQLPDNPDSDDDMGDNVELF